MSGPQFTPGPWKAKGRFHPADVFHVMWEERGAGWVRDKRLDPECSGGFKESDANLIAAAPDAAAFVKRHADAGDPDAQAIWEKICGRG